MMICSPLRLLDKLPVVCPNSDSCTESTQRGILEDHLRWELNITLYDVMTSCDDLMWWPHMVTSGTGVRAPWWRVSTRARAAPSGAPTRRSGSTRRSAASRRRVSAEMFLWVSLAQDHWKRKCTFKSLNQTYKDSKPKEHFRTPCTLCYIQYRKRLVYILIESRTSIEHSNSRRMNWIWI